MEQAKEEDRLRGNEGTLEVKEREYESCNEEAKVLLQRCLSLKEVVVLQVLVAYVDFQRAAVAVNPFPDLLGPYAGYSNHY